MRALNIGEVKLESRLIVPRRGGDVHVCGSIDLIERVEPHPLAVNRDLGGLAAGLPLPNITEANGSLDAVAQWR
jgi:hypothetical protein